MDYFKDVPGLEEKSSPKKEVMDILYAAREKVNRLLKPVDKKMADKIWNTVGNLIADIEPDLNEITLDRSKKDNYKYKGIKKQDMKHFLAANASEYNYVWADVTDTTFRLGVQPGGRFIDSNAKAIIGLKRAAKRLKVPVEIYQ